MGSKCDALACFIDYLCRLDDGLCRKAFEETHSVVERQSSILRYICFDALDAGRIYRRVIADSRSRNGQELFVFKRGRCNLFHAAGRELSLRRSASGHRQRVADHHVLFYYCVSVVNRSASERRLCRKMVHGLGSFRVRNFRLYRRDNFNDKRVINGRIFIADSCRRVLPGRRL